MCLVAGVNVGRTECNELRQCVALEVGDAVTRSTRYGLRFGRMAVRSAYGAVGTDYNSKTFDPCSYVAQKRCGADAVSDAMIETQCRGNGAAQSETNRRRGTGLSIACPIANVATAGATIAGIPMVMPMLPMLDTISVVDSSAWSTPVRASAMASE